jgi:hypothetical protein
VILKSIQSSPIFTVKKGKSREKVILHDRKKADRLRQNYIHNGGTLF